MMSIRLLYPVNMHPFLLTKPWRLSAADWHPLVNSYIQLLNEGMHGGWIDRYENKGKRTGAYSGGDYAHHPFVLMNYQGTLDNVFTLAHEMGHSLHSWYANHTHHYVDASYSFLSLKLPPSCNEALLCMICLKDA